MFRNAGIFAFLNIQLILFQVFCRRCKLLHLSNGKHLQGKGSISEPAYSVGLHFFFPSRSAELFPLCAMSSFVSQLAKHVQSLLAELDSFQSTMTANEVNCFLYVLPRQLFAVAEPAYNLLRRAYSDDRDSTLLPVQVLGKTNIELECYPSFLKVIFSKALQSFEQHGGIVLPLLIALPK